jgi:hypothetical protein
LGQLKQLQLVAAEQRVRLAETQLLMAGLYLVEALA